MGFCQISGDWDCFRDYRKQIGRSRQDITVCFFFATMFIKLHSPNLFQHTDPRDFCRICLFCFRLINGFVRPIPHMCAGQVRSSACRAARTAAPHGRRHHRQDREGHEARVETNAGMMLHRQTKKFGRIDGVFGN
jgi:hypothetical protein